jgi:hypothetical protein
MLTCAICSKEGLDLTFHLQHKHQLTTDQYKSQYNALVVDPSVELKRKETCESVHGDSNYKNEEARKLSFEVYEGGHPFSDPKVREAAMNTKMKLYGDPDYTNRDQAKETIKTKYGVENVAGIPGVVEKRIKTNLERYGKIFNYDPKPIFTKDQLEDLHYNQNKNLSEIGEIYGMTGEGVAYWMRKYGLKTRTIKLNKAIVTGPMQECKGNYSEEDFINAQKKIVELSKTRGVSRDNYSDNVLGMSTSNLESHYGTWNKFVIAAGLEPGYVAHEPYEHVRDYLKVCLEQNKVLSFYEYEKITGNPSTRFKRLFNFGKPYNNLKEELFNIALKKDLHETFLQKFKK